MKANRFVGEILEQLVLKRAVKVWKEMANLTTFKVKTFLE